MRPNDLLRHREAFNKSVDDAIKKCSRQTGVTDLETVYQYLKKAAPFSLKRLKALLADEQIRVIIQKRLKRCTVSVDDARTQAVQEAAQMEFEFFEMEQFRGLAQRISYTEGRIIKYVEYNRSLEWQRLSSIAHLDSGIAADVARRDAEIASNKFLQPLVKRFGDLEAQELVRQWLRDQRAGSAPRNGGPRA